MPHPPVAFEVLFLNIDGLVQYQLVHEQQNHLRIRYVSERDDVEAALVARFDGYLADAGLTGAVKVVLERVSEIERSSRGHKVRQIYSLVDRPHAIVSPS